MTLGKATFFLVSLVVATGGKAEHLDSIARFNRISRDKTAVSRTFDFDARLLFAAPGKSRMLMLFDASDHCYALSSAPELDEIRCGDLMNVRVSLPPDGVSYPQVNSLSLIERQGLGDATDSDVPGIRTESGTPPHLVRLSGVIHAVLEDDIDGNWIWIILATKGGNAYFAAIKSLYPLSALRPLVDAEVTLCGIVGNSSAVRRTDWKPVMLAGDDGISVRRPAPADPFAVQDSPRDGLHRQIITGTVVGITRSTLYVRADRMPLVACQLAMSPDALSVGDSVRIAGFAGSGFSSKTLSGCLIKTVQRRSAPLPDASPIRPSALFTSKDGNLQVQSRLNGKTIRLDGTVCGWRGRESEFNDFTLACDDILVKVDVSGLPQRDLLSLENGSELHVSGLCTIDFVDSPFASAFPRFTGVTLIPRTADDIVTVSRPPWWTPLRLLVVIVVLFVLATAILIWNLLLRHLSERRGRELMSEQLKRASADLRVNERTRIAVELHDALSQSLTGVSLQLDAVRRFADEDRDRMSKHLDLASRTLKSCREELRNCLWDLRNHALEEKDMNEAIRRTLAPFVGDAEVQIRFNVPRSEFSDDTAHAIMRIIRELASNAVRHGHARTIKVAGASENGRIVFSVRDDGTGFDTENRPGAGDGHFGLEGISERVNRFGGTFTVRSSPGKGSAITISLNA